MALRRCIARRHPLLDVVLDRLDHDDRIINHKTDREHQAKKRQRVN